MPTTSAYRATAADPQGQAAWEVIFDPPYLVCRGNHLLLELPPDGPRLRASVNGIGVRCGVQAVQPGDIVRISSDARGRRGGRDSREVRYIVGRFMFTPRCPEDAVCAFTGLPIAKGQQAIHCTCGAWTALDAAREIGKCPRCGKQLAVDAPDDQLPPEELL